MNTKQFLLFVGMEKVDYVDKGTICKGEETIMEKIEGDGRCDYRLELLITMFGFKNRWLILVGD